MNAEFTPSTICFVAPTYEQNPILIPSLRNQTYARWKLLLIHDGPASNETRDLVRSYNDERIVLLETEKRYNMWGHPQRQLGLELIKENKYPCTHVVVTNADNYYVPGFNQHMLRIFDENTQAVYCDCVHSYVSWQAVVTELRHSFIDCCCVMARRDLASTVGWRSMEYSSDWTYIHDLIRHGGGESTFKKAPMCLAIHN